MFKKFLSAVISAVTAVSFIPQIPAKAEETEKELYPYTLFAGSTEEGAITINSNNICINGNLATKGTISSSAQNFSVNGLKREQSNNNMVYLFDKIDASYFSGENVESHLEDYYLDATNININKPLDITGTASMTGNINIKTAFRATEDINLYGEVKNTEKSVIFSEYGDINIDSTNVNINGLIYAPFGNVNLKADNLNINSVIIVADTITITAPNLNCNYNTYFADFMGSKSEDSPVIVIDKKEMDYIPDENVYYPLSSFNALKGTLGIADKMDSFEISVFDILGNQIYYKQLLPEKNWCISDIGLMAGINEVVLSAIDSKGKKHTKSIKLLIDNTRFLSNLQIDLEDNDNDGLWNYMENYFGTDPDIPDTDGDGLNDYIEILSFGYDPLKVDSDDNGISDGEEDADSDGLSNLFEVNEFGSNPIFKDTDHDGLWDQQEFEFGTSPVLKDTDEDGISDYDEYYIFDTNPLEANSPDMMYTKEYTAEDCMVDYDKGIYPTITFTGDAEAIKSFSIEECDRDMYINPSMVGYLGSAYNFSTEGEFGSATLTFTYDPELLFIDDFSEEAFLPTIYYFNEETCELEELENQIRVGNTVTAELQHFSVYLLLNKKEIELFWNSPRVFPQTSIEEKAPEKHIAFLLDKTGSMRNNDPSNIRSKLVNDFAEKLGPQDSVKIYGFYDKKVIDYTGYRFVHNTQTITDAVDEFNSKKDGGNTYIASALSTVYKDMLQDKSDFELIKELSDDSDSSLEQYIFLLTDGESSDKVTTDFLDDLSAAEIKVYTVGLGSSVNTNYLRAISDATGGQYYGASVSEDLEDVYLKFGKDIESNDKNNDGIDDYYEYLMCEGLLTTKTGTNVFGGASYEEVMANDDFDGDGLINGDEVWQYTFFSSYPCVKLKSDPTTAYTDNDRYSDYEEYINNTNPRLPSVILPEEDYLYLFTNGDYKCAEAAEEYSEKSELGLALAYFTDVVFCNGVDYTKMLTSEFGSEQLLIDEDKANLVDYLSFMLNEPNDDDFIGDAVAYAFDTTNAYKDALEILDDLAGEKIKDVLVKKEIDDYLNGIRKSLRSRQSMIDKAVRSKSISKKTYNDCMKPISEAFSDLSKGDKGRMYKEAKGIYDESLSKMKKRGGKLGTIFVFCSYGYDRYEHIKELTDYSSKLELFSQFKDLLHNLSQSENSTLSEAAIDILNEIQIKENKNYIYKGTADFLYGAICDAVNLGIDEAIDIIGGEAAVCLRITQLLGSIFVGNTLAINREILMNAEFIREIADASHNTVYNNAKRITNLNSRKAYIYGEKGQDSVSITKIDKIYNYIKYAAYARQYGEDKYLKLCEEDTGVFSNPLKPTETKKNQANNNIVNLYRIIKENSTYVK